MPNPATQKLHRRRAERVIPGELEFSSEHAAFKGCPLGALDQRLPEEHVIFADGAGGYAVGGASGEELVFVEKALLRDGSGHCNCSVLLRPLLRV